MTEPELVTKDLPATGVQLLEKARDIANQSLVFYKTEQDRKLGTALLKNVVSLSKDFEAIRKEAVGPLNERVKAINGLVKEAQAPLQKVMTHYKGEEAAWVRKQQEEARKKAEAEAAKIAKKAERKAAKAEAEGDDYAAEEIRAQAEIEADSAIGTAAEPEKMEGVSIRGTWKVEVTNVKQFLTAILDGTDARLNINHIKVNQPELNKLVKALKEGARGLPGCRVFCDTTVSVRK